MEEKMVISRIINSFFNGMTPLALLASCPNYMLWEAIRRENARNIELHDIFAHLLRHDEFYLLPEPIPAIQNGVEPEYIKVKSSVLLCNDNDAFWDLVRKEPAYLVSCDFNWMIAMTTENTSCGDQLCVLVSASGKLDTD